MGTPYAERKIFHLRAFTCLSWNIRSQNNQKKSKQKRSLGQMVGIQNPFSSVHFSHSVVSDFLWPHGLQHARPPCPSPTPGAYSNSCPLSRWCHPAISSSVTPFSSCLQSSPASGSFSVTVLHIRWPKYWSFSFSISPSNEYSGLISFKMYWLNLLAVQGTLKSLLQHHHGQGLQPWN